MRPPLAGLRQRVITHMAEETRVLDDDAGGLIVDAIDQVLFSCGSGGVASAVKPPKCACVAMISR
jgi:hypothetical protein